MYSRCFSELVWTERSDDSRLLKYPSHCYMHFQACSHTEIEQVKRKMDTRVFFMNSFMVFSWLWRRKHKQRLVSTHFWGYSWGTGMSYHTSPIPGLLWMLFQLPASFPSVTPGCCEPNPLLSSVVGAQRGKPARPRGTQQCVSRVRGLAPLFLRRWNTSSSQGGESGRGELIPPWNCCTVFFIRSWLNNQEIKSQKELNSHSVWMVCMVCYKAFKIQLIVDCIWVLLCHVFFFLKTKMTLPFNQSQR